MKKGIRNKLKQKQKKREKEEEIHSEEFRCLRTYEIPLPIKKNRTESVITNIT